MEEYTGGKCNLSYSTHEAVSEEAAGGGGDGKSKIKNLDGAGIGKSFSKGMAQTDSKGSKSAKDGTVTGAKIGM